MVVCAIGDEIARPFVESACDRYGLPYDAQSGDAILWWVGFERGSVRSICGWADELDGRIVIVGPFGDGSLGEDRWLSEMLMQMRAVRVPYVVIPASPSLVVRRQSEQLERYGECRTPPRFTR